MLFSELPIDSRILKSLEVMQLTEMTQVQQRSIPYALRGNDICASSKTGSGKTMAFLVPAVNRLLTTKALSKKDPRAIILAPTRELAKQVFLQAKKLTSTHPLTCALIVGGENYNDQVKVLRKNPQIIVGTAGRIADHAESRSFFLNGVELLILDEADRMLELGFSEQLKLVHRSANHRKRQTMMFSATMDSAAVHGMTQEILNQPQRVEIDNAAVPHMDISQDFYYSDGVSHKDQILLKALEAIKQREQAIVFTATREDTQRIAQQLQDANIDAIALHGDMPQSQRSNVINIFSRGQEAVLVTTDLAARGLDLLNVALVINYDLPKFADEYIHRIGRTGRAGNKGAAVSFVSKKDWDSFSAIKLKLPQEYVFSEFDDLAARYKGTLPKKASTAAKSKGKTSTTGAADAPRKAPKKRFDNQQSVETGFIPVKRKARTQEDPDTSE